MKTTDTMTPEGKRLMAELRQLAELEVRAGFQRGKIFYAQEAAEGDEPKQPVDLADVVAWNELGTDHIPSRPFLRMTAEKNESEIEEFAKKCLVLLTRGEATAESVLKKIGAEMKGMIQETITDGEFIPNAPSTIARKRKNGQDPVKPLQDTGHMRDSVNFVIVKKGTPE